MTPIQASEVKVGDDVWLNKPGAYSDKDGVSLNIGIRQVVDKGVIEDITPGYWINNKQVSIECVRSYPEDFTPVAKLATGGFVGKPDQPITLFGAYDAKNDKESLINVRRNNELIDALVHHSAPVGKITCEQTVRDPINVNVTVNSDKLKCPDGIDRTGEEITKYISDQISKASLNPLKVIRDPKGTVTFTDDSGVERVRIGSLDSDNGKTLGVYRPNLEDRKVGKIRVELVDDGFPLALREVAKVMTWAQTAKGYKDHDWQNLPNPEQGLSGATSRHRSDFIIQRQVDKLPALECVDHESEIIHKAHEAFGVLAQLELMLRGVIK